jgi:hypothetical protein
MEDLFLPAHLTKHVITLNFIVAKKQSERCHTLSREFARRNVPAEVNPYRKCFDLKLAICLSRVNEQQRGVIKL